MASLLLSGKTREVRSCSDREVQTIFEVKEMKNSEKNISYVQIVQENTHNYVTLLLKENEKLSTEVAMLLSEIRLVSQKARRADSLQQENNALRALISSDAEKQRLQRQTIEAQEERIRQDEEKLLMERRLIRIEQESRAFIAQYHFITQQNSNLANLYFASYRLHQTVNRQQLIGAIQETIIQLIGSKDFGIFERQSGDRIQLIGHSGSEAPGYDSVTLGDGVIGRTVQTGDHHIGEWEERGTTDAKPVVACVPLILGEKTIGAIAIFRLPEYKSSLDALDFEVLDLLAIHAAAALYLSSTHSKS